VSTPTTEPIIRPDAELTIEAWQTIANELASEVTRLHQEIDRLKGGDAKAPMISRADHGHPLWETWVELDLDDVWHLADAHATVLHGDCPKCKGKLAPGPYGDFQMCEDDNLCFIAGHGSFALDEIDRARDRGPDA
jgi:hypothetical protein